MNKCILIGAIVAALGIGGGVAIGSYTASKSGPEYADIVAVDAVTETVTTPREVCHNETVTHQAPSKDTHNVVGTAVGAIFAGLVFVASAFSLPMMLDRNTDAITSALTSINAVKSNIPAMLVWAALIVSLVLVGFATAFVGFAVVLPWIGHATWHAYRETIAPAEKIKVYD